MSLDGPLSAQEIIERLGLQPHPEGGHYRETFRDPDPAGGRAASTAIYFLLREGERSHWHRVDAAEIWHYYAGAALELSIAEAGATPRTIRLGSDLPAGERPQAMVPAGMWQSARSLGAYTLVGCTVAPGFEFAGFELAPEGWTPDLPKAIQLKACPREGGDGYRLSVRNCDQARDIEPTIPSDRERLYGAV